MKRSLSSLEANSVLIEILMLEKAATSLPSSLPGIFCALKKIRGEREERARESSPASMPHETVPSTGRRLCMTRVAIKVNRVILAGGPKGPTILDHESISITCRANDTGPASEPPAHAHQGSRPSTSLEPPTPGLSGQQGLREGHINHTTRTSQARDNGMAWLSAVTRTRRRNRKNRLLLLRFWLHFQLACVSPPAPNGCNSLHGPLGPGIIPQAPLEMQLYNHLSNPWLPGDSSSLPYMTQPCKMFQVIIASTTPLGSF